MYYREVLKGKVERLKLVQENTALKIEAIRPFEDRQVGDEWLVKGPCMYYPRIEEKITATVQAAIVGTN